MKKSKNDIWGKIPPHQTEWSSFKLEEFIEKEILKKNEFPSYNGAYENIIKTLKGEKRIFVKKISKDRKIKDEEKEEIENYIKEIVKHFNFEIFCPKELQ